MGRTALSDEAAKTGDREQAARLMRLATYASVGTAVVLIVTKLAAWLYTDSVSLLASLIDSLPHQAIRSTLDRSNDV